MQRPILRNSRSDCRPLASVLIGAVAVSLWPCIALGGTDLKVNADPAGTVQNEVSLTIDLNPNLPGPAGANLVMTYNDNPGGGAGLGVSFSSDGGVTWTDRTIGSPAPSDPFSGASLNNIFDPASGSDTNGNVLAGYIAAELSPIMGGPASGLYVQVSTDSGNSWAAPIAVYNEAPGTPGGMNTNFMPFRFNDKPHLDVDNFASSANQGNVYLAWVQDDFLSAPSDIRFSASSNVGATWFPMPATVNDNPGTDRANGPNVAVAPNGDVYVAWLDVDVTDKTNPGPKNARLYVDKSTNGGMTWGMDVDVLNRTVNTLPDRLATNAGSAALDDVIARGYPVIAANPNDITGNTVYLTYAEDPDGPDAGGVTDQGDIFFVRSTNGGVTWSPPITINDDGTLNDQFAPWMAVKPNGDIDIAWYDKRLSANDDKWDVFIARSTDGGLTFSPNLRISDTTLAAPNNTGGTPWLGEYLGLAVDSTTAYLGFTTSQADALGDVYFDSILNSNIPEPTTIAMLATMSMMMLGRRRRSKTWRA